MGILDLVIRGACKIKDICGEDPPVFMKFASRVVLDRSHERFRLSPCERIMARRGQCELLIHVSTLDSLTDVSNENAKGKSRLNDQTLESVVLVDGMPRF